MEMIGDLSAIATLILFIFYFLGRIWSLRINKKFLYEKIELDGLANDEYKNQKRFYKINGDEVLKIVSAQYLNWIKIYSVSYSLKKQKFHKKTELIQTISDININEPIYISVIIPEGIPNIMIKYQRFDYIIGEFLVKFDGRGIGYSGKDYKFKNTLNTYIYYLVK